VKLAGLNSIWASQGAVDFLRYLWEIENEEGMDKKPNRVQMREGFESIKNRMMIELRALLVERMSPMSRYSIEIQRFKVTKQVSDSLASIWRLYSEMANNTTAAALLTMSGLSSLDTGAEFGPWTEKMEAALTALTKALNEDLAVKA